MPTNNTTGCCDVDGRRRCVAARSAAFAATEFRSDKPRQRPNRPANQRWMLLRFTLGAAAFVAALLGLSSLPGAAAEADAPRRAAEPSAAAKVVIVTGEDYPGHKWRETTPVLARALRADERLTIDVVESPMFPAEGDLGAYRVVVLHMKNYDPTKPGPEGGKRLAQFVRGGGGLVLVHFACGAFQEWPEFVELAGRVWNPKLRGHDPHGRFRVEIVDRKHPITAGMADFETTDELYTCLDGKTPITVLASARSKVDDRDYPIAFVLEYGKGRVFHCVLGHDVQSLQPEAVQTLFRRGTAWTAHLELEPIGRADESRQPDLGPTDAGN